MLAQNLEVVVVALCKFLLWLLAFEFTYQMFVSFSGWLLGFRHCVNLDCAT